MAVEVVGKYFLKSDEDGMNGIRMLARLSIALCLSYHCKKVRIHGIRNGSGWAKLTDQFNQLQQRNSLNFPVSQLSRADKNRLVSQAMAAAVAQSVSAGVSGSTVQWSRLELANQAALLQLCF